MWPPMRPPMRPPSLSSTLIFGNELRTEERASCVSWKIPKRIWPQKVVEVVVVMVAAMVVVALVLQ